MPRIGFQSISLSIWEKKGLLDFTLTENDIGETGRRGILFHTIKVQKIKEMNKGWEGIVLQRSQYIEMFMLFWR